MRRRPSVILPPGGGIPAGASFSVLAAMSSTRLNGDVIRIGVNDQFGGYMP